VTDPDRSTRSDDPIVITGIGLVTPLGTDRETTWRRLLAGERGVNWLQGEPLAAFLQTGFPRPWGGLAPLPENSVLTGRDRSISLARMATAEALADAALDPTDSETG
jgi:3-oxoacyl-[acyl-carrier-protein] synthase II